MSSRRILISGSGVYGGLPDSLRRAFEKNGWLVRSFDDQNVFDEQNAWAANKYVYRLFWRRLASGVQARLLSEVGNWKPDLVLIIKGFYFDPGTISRIKKLSPRTVLMHFNPDNTFNTWHFGTSNDWIRDSVPYYDAHLTWGEFLIPLINAAGAKKTFYMPFACDPKLHHPVQLNEGDLAKYGADVAFIGSWDEEREGWLSSLLDYNVKIWGNAWQKSDRRLRERWQRAAVYGSEFSKICNASKINLNLIRKQNVPAHNMRTFEIPACGGFMLSTRTKEQDAIWKEGEEIACFSGPQELRQVIDRYLADECARRAISSRARQKAHGYYSYEITARKIGDHFAILKNAGME